MYESKLNLVFLLASAIKLPYELDGSGALMAYRQSTPIASNSPFLDAANEIAQFTGLWAKYLTINVLPPGVIVDIHTDTLKNGEANRWHLPLQTNLSSFFWDEIHGRRHLPYGFWSGPIPHWVNHNVGNEGTFDRIHLVVDLY